MAEQRSRRKAGLIGSTRTGSESHYTDWKRVDRAWSKRFSYKKQWKGEDQWVTKAKENSALASGEVLTSGEKRKKHKIFSGKSRFLGRMSTGYHWQIWKVRSVRESELKMTQKVCPSCLLRIQLLRAPEARILWSVHIMNRWVYLSSQRLHSCTTMVRSSQFPTM